MSTGELVRALDVSAPSVHRMLLELRAQLVSAGKTRQRKHALRRSLRGTISSLPMFSVDENGKAVALTPMELVHPEGCFAPLDPRVWPGPPGHDDWWEGLPYPLYDMRPQGFLGRAVARAVSQQLRVSDNPEDWSDDDVLLYLAQFGSDQAGNLIVGEQAMQAWTRSRAAGALEPVKVADTARRYLKLAEAAAGLAQVGSSAGGEFPKFTAVRHLPGALSPHVIVKFSGSDPSAPVRRWSDLLVCEHLALEALSRAGHPVARSRIVIAGGRTFLESERFDRHGDYGRSPVVTLSSLQGALIGSRESAWPAVMRSPGANDLFRPEVVAHAEELHWFGRFIANSDMHMGNLSFRPQAAQFGPAPAYDMLPMHYAPLRGGEVPAALEFPRADLPAPPAGRESGWQRMLQAALGFWSEAAGDRRISDGFRAICSSNLQQLQRFADLWASAEVDHEDPAQLRRRE